MRAPTPSVRALTPPARAARSPRIGSLPRPSSLVGASVVAVALTFVAFDGGGYTLESRGAVGILLWWAIALVSGLALLPLRPLCGLAGAITAFLVAFATWTGLSTFWSHSAELSVNELNRVLLYLAIFLIATATGRGSGRHAWSGGLALGIVAVAVSALATRLFSGLSQHDQLEFLPGAITRLSYPLGYWNGLAIFVGLAFPLLLSLAAVTSARRAAVLVGATPLLASVLYLTSSRGGFVTAATGTVVFLVTTRRRALAALGAFIASAGSLIAVLVLVPADALANGPLDSSAAEEEGRLLAVILPCVSVVAAVGYAALRARLEASAPRADRLALTAVVVAVAAGLVLVNPLRFAADFRDPPVVYAEDDFVRTHLLSSSGSGRWQFWGAAGAQFETAPVMGQGAGSFEAWWAEHGSLELFARDAHSLYLETLGELGLVGLAILLAGLVLGCIAFRRSLRLRDDGEAVLAAGIGGAFVAFCVAASFDWVWELTAVGGVGVSCLGLLAAASSDVDRRASERVRHRSRHRASVPTRLIVATAAGAIVVVQAVPWVAALEVAHSQDAAARGDAGEALASAHRARTLQPWAATPHLQVALVEERLGNVPAAVAAVGDAIEVDARDWRLWLTAARLQTKAGEITTARRSLRRARELNPRSPILGPSP